MSPGADRPILVCHDGSEHSQRALHAISGLLTGRPVVVLCVWQAVATRLSETGAFGAYTLGDESRIDDDEARAAQAAADEGARRARDAGYEASARSEQAQESIWRTIVDVADELDVALIVCATRGRGPVQTALLGSVSHSVLRHAGRPVLISPDPRS